ncbi:MAG: diacylglycerol/lipid kinase family protein [Persicimonas sp.]
MSTWVIINPEAGSAAKNQHLLARVRSLLEVEARVTSAPGDATRLARQACVQGAQRVVAAGGDGTVNEVLNGIAGHLSAVTLGVLPLGTGNDVARALGMPDDPDLALSYLLESNDVRQIDLMRVSNPSGSRLALNHVNAGYSNLVNEQITAEMKQRWGPFAYLKAAASRLGERREYHTRIIWEDGAVEVIDAVNVFVANGPTVAGGLRIAPQASLEDGMLHTFVFKSGSLVELAGMAARALVGDLTHSEHVISRPTGRLHVESTPPMIFNVDGEAFCEQIVEVRVIPGALRAIVGPKYVVAPTAAVEADRDASSGSVG